MNDFGQCLKCTICTVYCPVVPVNTDFPGPKQAGPDGERYRLKNGLFYDDTLKYCLNCKRCEVACPSGILIGDIIQKAKMKYGPQKAKLRDAMLAETDFMGSVATVFAPIANPVLATRPVKAIMDSVLKIDHRRTFPKYSGQTFVRWFRKHAAASQDSYSRKAVYFHGCYVNYNFPELGKDFVAVMNALGYGVSLIEDEKCCGTALIANAMGKRALKQAQHNVKAISAASCEGSLPVLATSSTCSLTIRDEYPHVLGVDNSSIRESVSLAVKFIYSLVEKGTVKLVFKPEYRARIAYHAPCHMEKLGWSIFSEEIVRMIPGVELTVLDSNCCGISGTYGFKKENYEVSQAIGKPLFDQIAAVNPDFIACDCETCKWQLEMSTPYKVKNPISILAEALDLEATEKANR
ncbi:MAG: anaerobic glycerol-3-phosphate dehydrogenase subunit GlpC [Bacteroidales bacterium]|nr:anaerobic glycerol-3-phosphate dehydrogenase subunit GlpC [Bacteroides sp.]MCM1198328.1 anaerobic glycerol-3-phosphate dehydrogenase subunit GlpC [Clostridium sp.]MCM1501481.1 anaerobic glycerol-3-phosphate dehydrogenase subunit GlpC [Bacteroidales bacterium]